MLCEIVLAFGLISPSLAQNPCTDNATDVLGFLSQRMIGYNLTEGEDPICDYYLVRKWYSMYNFVLTSSTENCGTSYNWYRRDPLPTTANVQTDIVMCRNGIASECDDQATIQAVLCDDGTYVFHIGYLNGCPEAYCIEDPDQGNIGENIPIPDISKITPIMGVAVKKTSGNNTLEFYCDFTPEQNTDFFYTVQFAITTGLTWTDSLHESQPVRYLSKADFREQTKLTEQHLKLKQMWRLGITIACSLAASTTVDSEKSPVVLSPGRFFGFELVNSTEIVLTNSKSETIFFKITVPFGCAGDAQNCYLDTVMITPSDTNCFTTTLVQQHTERACGVRFRQTDHEQNGEASLKIESLQGTTLVTHTELMYIYLKTTPYTAHPIFSEYIFDPIPVTVKTNKDLLRNKYCYSRTDPHMYSFDGEYYSNQNGGKFILYRHVRLQQEVQIQTQSCGNGVSCNCGVAVRAGADLYIANFCGSNFDSGRFRKCRDGTLFRKLKEISKYQLEIQLPTGTKVNIQIVTGSYGVWLNIYMYPSVADYKSIEGLCGNFDGLYGNDRVVRPGSAVADPILSWGVLPAEDLFNENNDPNLEPWEETQKVCQCNGTLNPSGPVSTATCDADTEKRCEYQPSSRRCSSYTKRKRRDGSDLHRMHFDFYKTTRTAFISKVKPNEGRHKRFQKRSTAYTNETARSGCMEIINTTAYRQCSKIPGLKLDSVLIDCVFDAVATQSMDWTIAHLESIKSECVREIKAEQLPPPEALVGVSLEINGTLYSNITENNVTLPFIPEFSPESLTELEDSICLNECSGQGLCVNGVCKCNTQFLGVDCSIDSSKPPEMKGITDEGLCDLQQRDCETAYVIGLDIADTPQLTCRITPIEVTTSAQLKLSSFSVNGKLETLMEVSCNLTQHRRRKKNTDENTPDKTIAKGYKIAISNDGELFSEEDVFAYFDSECVQCDRIAGYLKCTQMPGVCVSNGECYSLGETIGCFVCTGDSSEVALWQQKEECAKADVEPPNSETPKLWILAATIVPVVGLTAIGIVGFAIFLKAKKKAIQK